MATSKSTSKYTYAVGRRKSAIATIKMYSGKGSNTVNNKPIEQYFPITDKIKFLKPFSVTQTLDKFHFEARIIGGGLSGQLDALVLAVSRALHKINPELKTILRQQSLLTVDPRVRERRMVGTGGKSRRQKQSPKR